MSDDRSISRATYEEKRRLRAEIARQRRQIDASRRNVQHEAGELVSWRTYVRRYPLAALGVAAGLGAVMAVGFPGKVAGSLAGRYLLRAGLGMASAKVWDELYTIWTDKK